MCKGSEYSAAERKREGRRTKSLGEGERTHVAVAISANVACMSVTVCQAVCVSTAVRVAPLTCKPGNRSLEPTRSRVRVGCAPPPRPTRQPPAAAACAVRCGVRVRRRAGRALRVIRVASELGPSRRGHYIIYLYLPVRSGSALANKTRARKFFNRPCRIRAFATAPARARLWSSAVGSVSDAKHTRRSLEARPRDAAQTVAATAHASRPPLSTVAAQSTAISSGECHAQAISRLLLTPHPRASSSLLLLAPPPSHASYVTHVLTPRRPKLSCHRALRPDSQARDAISPADARCVSRCGCLQPRLSAAYAISAVACSLSSRCLCHLRRRLLPLLPLLMPSPPLPAPSPHPL